MTTEERISAKASNRPKIWSYFQERLNQQALADLSLGEAKAINQCGWRLRYGVLTLVPPEEMYYDLASAGREAFEALLQQRFKLRKVKVALPPEPEPAITRIVPQQPTIQTKGVVEHNLGEVALCTFGRGATTVTLEAPRQPGLTPKQTIQRWFRRPVKGKPGIFEEVEVAMRIDSAFGPPRQLDVDFLTILKGLTVQAGCPKRLEYFPWRVLKMARQGDSKSDYLRLDLALHRWRYNGILWTSGGWYDAAKEQWIDVPDEVDDDKVADFALIQQFEPLFKWDRDEEKWQPKLSDLYDQNKRAYIVWSDRLHNNIQEGWVAWSLPLDVYFGLKPGLPRAIYRYAWKRLRGQPNVHREPLKEFYEGRMGLSGSDQGPANMKRKLKLERVRHWIDANGRQRPTHLKAFVDRKRRQIVFVGEEGFGRYANFITP